MRIACPKCGNIKHDITFLRDEEVGIVSIKASKSGTEVVLEFPSNVAYPVKFKCRKCGYEGIKLFKGGRLRLIGEEFEMSEE